MPFRMGRVAAAALFVCLCGFAQGHKVAAGNQHERVIAIVPMIQGDGTMENPTRPMFVPAPGQVPPGSKTEIIGFHFVPSDDGKLAIVELIARDKAAFREILASTDPRVHVFLRGRDDPAALLPAIRKIRKQFSLENFGEVVVP
jgi:hypothetical protein